MNEQLHGIARPGMTETVDSALHSDSPSRGQFYSTQSQVLSDVRHISGRWSVVSTAARESQLRSRMCCLLPRKGPYCSSNAFGRRRAGLR